MRAISAAVVTVVGAGDVEEGKAAAGDGTEVVGARYKIRKARDAGCHVLDALAQLLEVPKRATTGRGRARERRPASAVFIATFLLFPNQHHLVCRDMIK